MNRWASKRVGGWTLLIEANPCYFKPIKLLSRVSAKLSVDPRQQRAGNPGLSGEAG
jgi:hypothetical protein